MASVTAQVRTTGLMQPIGGSDTLVVGVAIDRSASGVLGLNGANTTAVKVPIGDITTPGLHFAGTDGGGGLVGWHAYDQGGGIYGSKITDGEGGYVATFNSGGISAVSLSSDNEVSAHASFRSIIGGFLASDLNFSAGTGFTFIDDADTSYSRTAPNVLGIFAGNVNVVQVTALGAGVTGTLAATGAITGSNLSGTHSGTSSGTNSGDVTLATIGGTANGNGASLSGQVLTLQPADATFGGILTAGTQSIAGAKTFTGAIAASNLSGTNTGNVTLSAIGSSANSNGATLTSQALNLEPASASFGGVVTTGTQTFAGLKNFNSTTGLGIGTATPLTLQGTAALTGKALQLQNTADHAQLILSAGGSGKVPVINLENTDATSGKRLFQQYYNGANNYLQMTFASESTGTGVASVGLYLSNTGKVGIGRASGSATLDLNSDGTVSAPAFTMGATADDNTGIWHPAAETLEVAVNGVAGLRVGYQSTNVIAKVAIAGASLSSSSGVLAIAKTVADGIPTVQASGSNGSAETNIDARAGGTTTTDYATVSVTNPAGTGTPQLVMYAFPSAIGGTYFGASSRNSSTALLHLNSTGLMFIGSVAGADVYFGRGNLECLRFTSTEVVVNDASRDCDFRVETDTNANAFIIDAGADTITCGSAFTASAAATFSSTMAVNGTMTFANAINMVFNTSTGTKIGTGTTQKIGFYNAAPVAQGASVADPTGGAIIDAECRAQLIALITRIEALGLIATV